jgi:Iap family predicted aminopeptidase
VKLAPKRANEIKNKAVIVYGGLGGNLQEFRALMNSGAKAIIMNDGRYPVPWLIASGMPYLWMKEKMLPVVTPKYFDTVDLLKEGVKEVFVKVVGKKKKFVSQNVVGFKKGRSKKNIVVTAHHDSVMVGEGATDNATGVAILLEISRRLEKIPQQEKGVYLVSFGSEEVLSYGALNFVKENEEVVENSVFAINFDSCSSFYGENKILITGEDKLTSYIEKEVDRSGKWFNLSSDTSPFSDHFPFNVKGVPSIWFRRHNSSQGYFPFHSHLNQLEIVDFNVMEEVVDISFKMICELADIPEMPFPREISSQNKEKISYYHKELCGSMLDK